MAAILSKYNLFKHILIIIKYTCTLSQKNSIKRIIIYFQLKISKITDTFYFS